MVIALITRFIINRTSTGGEEGERPSYRRSGEDLYRHNARYLCVNDSRRRRGCEREQQIMDCRWVENYFSNKVSHHWNGKAFSTCCIGKLSPMAREGEQHDTAGQDQVGGKQHVQAWASEKYRTRRMSFHKLGNESFVTESGKRRESKSESQFRFAFRVFRLLPAPGVMCH